MSPKATALLACTVLTAFLAGCDAPSSNEPQAEKSVPTSCEQSVTLVVELRSATAVTAVATSEIRRTIQPCDCANAYTDTGLDLF